MKVKVNKEACIGCGACAALVDKVFTIEDDGLAKAVDEKIKDELKDEVIDAAEGCPTEAIEIIKDK